MPLDSILTPLLRERCPASYTYCRLTLSRVLRWIAFMCVEYCLRGFPFYDTYISIDIPVYNVVFVTCTGEVRRVHRIFVCVSPVSNPVVVNSSCNN